MRAWRDIAVAVVLGATPACAHGDACPARRTCDARRGGDTTAVDGRSAIALASDSARAGEGDAGDALPVGARRTFVRFDLAPLAQATSVERAVLSLAPHPAWRSSATPLHLTVRRVEGAWRVDDVGAGREPAVAEVLGEATLAAGVRSPVRVDVTEAVRAWLAGDASAQGLALEIDGGAAVFAGAGAATTGLRPRIEMVLR